MSSSNSNKSSDRRNKRQRSISGSGDGSHASDVPYYVSKRFNVYRRSHGGDIMKLQFSAGPDGTLPDPDEVTSRPPVNASDLEQDEQKRIRDFHHLFADDVDYVTAAFHGAHTGNTIEVPQDTAVVFVGPPNAYTSNNFGHLPYLNTPRRQLQDAIMNRGWAGLQQRGVNKRLRTYTRTYLPGSRVPDIYLSRGNDVTSHTLGVHDSTYPGGSYVQNDISYTMPTRADRGNYAVSDIWPEMTSGATLGDWFANPKSSDKVVFVGACRGSQRCEPNAGLISQMDNNAYNTLPKMTADGLEEHAEIFNDTEQQKSLLKSYARRRPTIGNPARSAPLPYIPVIGDGIDIQGAPYGLHGAAEVGGLGWAIHTRRANTNKMHTLYPTQFHGNPRHTMQNTDDVSVDARDIDMGTLTEQLIPPGPIPPPKRKDLAQYEPHNIQQRDGNQYKLSRRLRKYTKSKSRKPK